MNIYNPLVTGETITLDSKSKFSKDSTLSFDTEQGEKLLEKYPFLVNMDDESKSPDACEDTRNIPMKEWYSGRATARLSDELRSITRGISEVVNKVDESISKLHGDSLEELSDIRVMISKTNDILEEIRQTSSQTQEINTKILEELILERKSKFSFKKIFKR